MKGFIKARIKKRLIRLLQPYGFTVDGIKPPGSYLSPQELNYQAKGFANLREYFQHKWNSNVQERCNYYVKRFFKPRLLGQERVVEIGTGAGFFTHSLLSEFPHLHYFSYELDKNLQHYLDKEFHAYHFTSMECVGNDLNAIKSHSVDVVVGFGIFTYVSFSNLMQYLCECSRVCKNNGLLFFDIFDTDHLCDPLLAMFEDYSLKGNNRPFISGKLLTQILAKKGFSLVDSYQEERDNPQQYYSQKMLFQKNQNA